MWEVALRGLTYDGCVLHSVINHGLCVVMTVALAWKTPSSGRRHAGWLVCLLLVSALQVMLWWFGAMGVSLVWCALCGYGLTQFRGTRGAARVGLVVALLLAVAGLVFYAMTFPAITTVAHACAVLVGVVIGKVWNGLEGAVSGARTARSRKHAKDDIG
ncbi:hypothetical protein SAMN05428989_0237 [Pseudoxanthomonas sp. GM95]|uniref:hypothetical protein n=1 Tax=Pseudoxanthomonas sp. GM95 TaxID=1881043 RepID=UPI0008AC3CCB|nr:hypothetical protein [Pseudoxanthomonas sp. GM95]SEK50347.1 hypothetical protein SAMN05428989_0237 [Pseudoxanthomonas sp. GM95]